MRIVKDGKVIGVRDDKGKDFYFDPKDNKNPPSGTKIVDPGKEKAKESK